MTDFQPYLIAHKVRGKLDFAIAEKLIVNGEELWIISSIGHRAYPFWTKPLADFNFAIPEMPESLRDFFSIHDRQVKARPEPKAKMSADDLLKLAGL